MRLVIASNNAKKRREITAVFYCPELTIIPVTDTIHIDVIEDGLTFAANARKKAESFAKANACAALADDSGLCVDALGGEPGIYSARFAGEPCDDAANNQRLLASLAGQCHRQAHFICHICLVLPEHKLCLSAEGRVEGYILDSLDGHQGFGYDPLFFSTELGKSFASASATEKASVSHRGRALRAIHLQLQQYMQGTRL